MKILIMEEKCLEGLSEELIDFSKTSKRIFSENKGVFYIGGLEINEQMRNILREQSNYILTSQIFEVLDATIVNESASLALLQSTNYEHVQFAKALFHWNSVLKKMLLKLGK
jgi:hypothetical protein